MSDEDYSEAARLFNEACNLEPETRAAFLERACGSNQALRAEIESLLAHNQECLRGDREAAEIDGTFRMEGLFDSVTARPSENGDSPKTGGESCIGSFRILRKLGEGGMGLVHLGRDTKLNRLVAIKSLPSEVSDDAEVRARFEREAQLLASLNHPNIGAIYQLEESKGKLFLILEYIPGETLESRLVGGSLTVEAALTFGRQLVEAITAAHTQGVIHRDLKPKNIMITPRGQVKVLDFGIARALGGGGATAGSAPALTLPGAILGSPVYMSPEQASGEAADFRADIWAFGGIMFEMLTGKPPFSGETLPELFASILNAEPNWDVLPAEVPVALKGLLRACLTKDKNARPTSLDTAALTLAGAREKPAARITERPATENNLPRILTSFVGREKEKAEVKNLLQRSALVTLTGIGGCGKSRLSLELGQEVLEEYENGVWLVELASLDDPRLVPQFVAGALNIREEPRVAITETLQDFLREKKLLLILDNCEHLLKACAELSESLLRRCKHLSILATSREALGISGENPYHVPSLSTPDLTPATGVASIVDCESVQLFRERATVHRSGFELSDSNAVAVAQICSRLDGIPLALELAAAKVKMLPVEEIAARLDDRFRLLTGGSRTAVPHQQTLRALIDWSYDLLDESEKALFRSLSVFRGGWTLDAAVAVHCGEAGGEYETLDSLTRLAEKSLVEVVDQGTETRYQMLETVRQYSLERLQEAGEKDAISRGHLDYYLSLAGNAELASPDPTPWLDRVELEHENLRAAFEWAKADTGSTVRGFRLAAALLDYWKARGYESEGESHLKELLAGEPATGQSKARAFALHTLWAMLTPRGEFAAARSVMEESLEIFRKLGDKTGIAVSLLNMGGLAHVEKEDKEAAKALFEESLAIFKELGRRDSVALVLNSLAALSASVGNMAICRVREGTDEFSCELVMWFEEPSTECDYDAARTLYKEILSIYRELDSEAGIAVSLLNLGTLAASQADFAEAKKLIREALVIYRQQGRKRSVASCLSLLARVAHMQNDNTAARSLCEECVAIERELGCKKDIAGALCFLGILFESQGDLPQARRFLDEGLAIRRDIDDKKGTANALEILARVTASEGDYTAARLLYEKSLALFRELKSTRGIATFLEGMASLLLAEEKPRPAARLLGAAQALRDAAPGAMELMERRRLDRCRDAVRKALGEAAFDAAFDEGSGMNQVQAIEYARGETGDSTFSEEGKDW